MNFSYPRKIVNSIIEDENLVGRPYFRYRKAVILMGANATGKTSLGKALFAICSFINSGNPSVLFPLCTGHDTGDFTIDFVNGHYILHRVSGEIDRVNQKVTIQYYYAPIEEKDSYERCVGKLKEKDVDIYAPGNQLLQQTGILRCRFAYPEINPSLGIGEINPDMILKTLNAVISTLDPSFEEVVRSKDLKNSYIIRRGETEIIIQDGKLLNKDVLSSGTAEGIDVSLFLSSILSENNGFYYCDEHFSYIQSDIEKRIFGIMVENLKGDAQLVFTTHNTDMLDLNLPKHSFAFLRRNKDDHRISVIYASDLLKRNTDSVKCAAENDIFDSLPDDSPLDSLERG